jgi:hypothetical protein
MAGLPLLYFRIGPVPVQRESILRLQQKKYLISSRHCCIAIAHWNQPLMP